MLNQFRYALTVAALSVCTAGASLAQEQPPKKEPGGVNKVAQNVSKTMKKAGRDTKAQVKRSSSDVHWAAKDAGNATKKTLSKATGIKGSQKENPGGLNKAARDVSKTLKKAGRDTRDEKNRVKAKAHATATDAGKAAKSAVKDTTQR